MTRLVSSARSAVSNRTVLRDMGSALSCNGSSTIAVRLSQTAYNLGTFSISFWIKASAQTAYNGIFCEGNSVSSNQIFAIRTAITAGRPELVYYIRDDANAIRTETPTIRGVLDGSMHHVVFTDANGSVKIYVDGVLDRMFSYTRGTLTLDRTSLGGLQRATAAIWTRGIVDELRVWSAELTAAQVTDLYYRNAVPSGLVLEWLLNENSGTTATDTSGSGGNATITAPTWVTGRFLALRGAAAARPVA